MNRCANCGVLQKEHKHSRLRGYICPGGRTKFKLWTGKLTGNCPIREHTGAGDYVGACTYACYDGVCPRHGRVSDYPCRDDRDVDIYERDFRPEGMD